MLDKWGLKQVHVGFGDGYQAIITLIQLCASVALNRNNCIVKHETGYVNK